MDVRNGVVCGWSGKGDPRIEFCYDEAMEPNAYDLQLEELAKQSTIRLLSAEIFDRQAFLNLKSCIEGKAGALRETSVLSKQILGCLRSAAAAIRNQAPHVREAEANLLLADEFEMLLDLLIMSETPQDRLPGVPRIV